MIAGEETKSCNIKWSWEWRNWSIKLIKKGHYGIFAASREERYRWIASSRAVQRSTCCQWFQLAWRIRWISRGRGRRAISDESVRRSQTTSALATNRLWGGAEILILQKKTINFWNKNYSEEIENVLIWAMRRTSFRIFFLRRAWAAAVSGRGASARRRRTSRSRSANIKFASYLQRRKKKFTLLQFNRPIFNSFSSSRRRGSDAAMPFCLKEKFWLL